MKISRSEASKLGAIESRKTAAIQKQNRIDAYNLAPKQCKFCSEPIPYDKRANDFCNHSCAAAFNNKGVRRHGEPAVNCLNCNAQTPTFAGRNRGNGRFERAKRYQVEKQVIKQAHII